MKRKLFASAILILALLLSVTACGPKAMTVDPEQLVVVEYDGIDGYATPRLNVNPDYLLEIVDHKDKLDDLSELQHLKDKEKEEYETRLEYLDALKVRFDQEYTRLTNGDRLTVLVDDVGVLSEQTKLSLEKNSFEVTVSGLPEGEKLDAVRDVEIEFQGYDGEGTAYLRTNAASAALPVGIKWEVDRDEDLSNGDVIVLTALYDKDELGERGYVMDVDRREITVEGLQVLEPLDIAALFEDVTLEYEGIAPLLYVNLDLELPEELVIEFDLDKSPPADGKSYRMGETFEVWLRVRDVDRLKRKGYRPTELEVSKSVTIEESDAPSYLFDLSRLSEQDKAQIIELMEERMEIANAEATSTVKYGDTNYNFGRSETEFVDFVEIYWMTYAGPNIYHSSILTSDAITRLVFVGEFHGVHPDRGEFKAYHYAELNDIILEKDGSITIDPEKTTYLMSITTPMMLPLDEIRDDKMAGWDGVFDIEKMTVEEFLAK